MIPLTSSSHTSDYTNDSTVTHSLYLYVNLNILAQKTFQQQYMIRICHQNKLRRPLRTVCKHDITNYLSVVSAIQCHSVIPEVFKEMWKDFILDVLRFHTVSSTALLDHF